MSDTPAGMVQQAGRGATGRCLALGWADRACEELAACRRIAGRGPALERAPQLTGINTSPGHKHWPRLVLYAYPQGDSNPCLQDENLIS